MSQTEMPSLYPSGREWVHTNDAVMTPDRGFVKQLRKLHPKLEVVWDWGAEKWQIWMGKNKGQPAYHITTVQTLGRTYRELGADVLLGLQNSINIGPEGILAYLEEVERQDARRREKDLRNLIDSIARDTFINIHCKIIQVPQKYSIAKAVSNG